MPVNSAAWLKAAEARPFVIEPSPYKRPGPGQILIKTAAMAINPGDSKLQDKDHFGMKYPQILGMDVAGEVIEVGDEVTGFMPGQRVLGFATGMVTGDPSGSGFQHYVLLSAGLASVIPDSILYTSATVLPLSVATAAAGLYQQDYLGLTLPTVPPTPRSATPKVVIIWGGSSSVGSSVIQLAVASGYDVLVTASERNLEYCRKLGATLAFNHTHGNVVEQLVAASEGREVVGFFDAIALPETLAALVDIATRTSSVQKVASVQPGLAETIRGVEVKGVFAPMIADNEVGRAMFSNFLPLALAKETFLAKPDPLVVGHGLDSIQDGVDKVSAGVSAVKIVVTL